MIISKTPLRISFIGGGSDIQSFYKHQTGSVVATAINKHVYIAVNKQFDGRIIINYSKTETVKKVQDIENDLVREALRLTGIDGGIHITSIADIPSEGTGMGSSSSYIVGLLNVLYAYQGKHVNAQRLAEEACKIEIDILKRPIGKQDQYMAAYGGFRHIKFNSDDSVFIDPIICNSLTKKKLKEKLLLFYTGITRSSNPILSEQSKNLEKDQTRIKMTKMVLHAENLYKDLKNNKLSAFGNLLHQSWLLKKSMAKGITTLNIDGWYKKALENGAIGGKILGAGGGGFLLLYAPKSNHQRIINCLSGLIPIQFDFEPQGSKIIFVD